jgi:hypothetical protein
MAFRFHELNNLFSLVNIVRCRAIAFAASLSRLLSKKRDYFADPPRTPRFPQRLSRRRPPWTAMVAPTTAGHGSIAICQMRSDRTGAT